MSNNITEFNLTTMMDNKIEFITYCGKKQTSTQSHIISKGFICVKYTCKNCLELKEEHDFLSNYEDC